MQAARRQPVSQGASEDFIPISEAATLTGMSVRAWSRRAIWEEGVARVQQRASLAVKMTPVSGGKPCWHVSRGMDPRLTRFPDNATRAERDRPGLLAKYPTHSVDAAYRRAHWLKVWRTRCDRRGDGDTELSLAAEVVAECRRIEGEGFKVTVRTLQRWQHLYTAIGVDGKIAGVGNLIDKRSVPSTGGGDEPPKVDRDQAAIDWFYSLYRTDSQLAARMCHDATVREARRCGWAWPSSYASTTRWLREHDDRSLTFVLRYGKDRWARRYLPHIEVDYGAIGPGDLFVCDHHQADWWCVYKGKQIRPWLTAIQDCRSRCIVGWHLGPAAHQDAILASMRRAFREWAIPVKMRIDNGRDYTSKLITGVTKEQRNRLRRELGPDWQRVLRRSKPQDGPVDARWLGICGELRIDLIYAIPYAPWSKGTLERWFGRMEGQHGKTSYVTYCGNSAVNKPECLDEIRRGYSAEQRRRLQKLHGDDWHRIVVLKFIDQADIPTLEECRERLGEWVDTYHLSPHRGLHGATPLAVWQTAGSLQRAVEDDLLCLMQTRGIYRVGGNGVRVNVGGGAIGYGQRCAALKPYVGRDVLVALNPDDISHVWAFTPDRDKRKPIGRLDANERIAPNTCADDAREAIAETMRDRKMMRSAARTSARRTRTQVQRINEHSRAVLAELRKTGTDDTGHTPTIAPVQTGFEGGSKGPRSSFNAAEYEPLDGGDIEDLFDEGFDTRVTETDDDQGMDALFTDEEVIVPDGSDDDDLEAML